MAHFKHHLFFCTNQRADGRASCGDHGAARVREYAKAKSKALGLAGRGGVRVNTAGCLDRCDLGPALVIYPEGVWYAYVDEDDVDEIFERHIGRGEIVERLLLDRPDQSDQPNQR